MYLIAFPDALLHATFLEGMLAVPSKVDCTAWGRNEQHRQNMFSAGLFPSEIYPRREFLSVKVQECPTLSHTRFFFTQR